MPNCRIYFKFPRDNYFKEHLLLPSSAATHCLSSSDHCWSSNNYYQSTGEVTGVLAVVTQVLVSSQNLNGVPAMSDGGRSSLIYIYTHTHYVHWNWKILLLSFRINGFGILPESQNYNILPHPNHRIRKPNSNFMIELGLSNTPYI